MSTAATLLAAERDGTTLAAFDPPADLDAAERIQDALLADWGETAGAWKLGATVAAVRANFGLPRGFFGLIPQRRTYDDGATRTRADLRQCVIELEIAFTLATALPARPEAYAADEVRAAVAGVRAAFELPQSRFAALGAFGPLALVADNGGGGAAVIGPLNPDWDAAALATANVTIAAAGLDPVAGSAADIIDGPFGALVAMVEQARARGHDLAAGTHYLTGACALLVEPAITGRVAGTIDGVGTVALVLA